MIIPRTSSTQCKQPVFRQRPQTLASDQGLRLRWRNSPCRQEQRHDVAQVAALALQLPAAIVTGHPPAVVRHGVRDVSANGDMAVVRSGR